MTIFQGRTGRKITGGRYRKMKGKKKRELGKPAAHTSISPDKDEVRKRSIRQLGGEYKQRLLRTTKINALDPETGKTTQAVIDSVIENPASKEFRRRNIITKGALLKTSAGDVKVTNRPGQEGHINGIIITE